MAPLVDAAKSHPGTTSAKPANGPPYELFDCLVDLQKKRILPLRSAWPYWPNKNHGDLKVVWSRRIGDVEYAAVVNNARFFTEDLWLITTQNSGMSRVELAQRLNEEVDRILKAKRPLTYSAYGISWLQNDNVAGVFTKNSANLEFTAEIPKSSYEDVEGVIAVDLATGNITKSACNTHRDNPFLDNPKLAKVDQELNKTYAALLHQLSEPQRTELKKEQRYWLANRDYAEPLDAGTNLSASVIVFKTSHLSPVPDISLQDEDFASFNRTRDESLIESTKKRTAELRSRLRND